MKVKQFSDSGFALALHVLFKALGIDYIDVFFWGWIGSDDGPRFKDCLDISNDLRG
jgi:hypothetical protein